MKFIQAAAKTLGSATLNFLFVDDFCCYRFSHAMSGGVVMFCHSHLLIFESIYVCNFQYNRFPSFRTASAN